MKTKSIAISWLLASLFVTFPCLCLGDAERKDKTAEPPSKVSLLVVEGLPGNRLADPQILVRYRFEKGIRVAREEILKTPNSLVRYDLGNNMTYLDRYAITRWGDIIDIKDLKLLHEGNSERIGCDGNRVILRRQTGENPGLYSYDLSQKKIEKLLPSDKWNLVYPEAHTLLAKHLLSPDGMKSVSLGKNGTTITLHRLNQETKTLAGGMRSGVSTMSSSDACTPMVWLDDETILTQKTNGKLVAVNLEGTVSPLMDLPCKDLPLSPPKLYKDAGDRIIYVCVKSYVIDVKNRKYWQQESYKFGHDFEMEKSQLPQAASSIRYRGEEIGRHQVNPESAKTISGHFAAFHAPTGKNPGEAAGVKVWSSLNGEWTTLKLDWAEIIGWIDDSKTADVPATQDKQEPTQ